MRWTIKWRSSVGVFRNTKTWRLLKAMWGMGVCVSTCGRRLPRGNHCAHGVRVLVEQHFAHTNTHTGGGPAGRHKLDR